MLAVIIIINILLLFKNQNNRSEEHAVSEIKLNLSQNNLNLITHNMQKRSYYKRKTATLGSNELVNQLL
jgi:hypothetical protein